MRAGRLWFLAALALGLFAAASSAQQPSTYPAPLLQSVFPPGGKAGTTVEVTVEGKDLDDATALYFSTPGLKAERIPDPPADPKKKNAPPAPTKFKVTIAANAPGGVHDLRVVGKWGISNPRAFAIGEMPEVAEKEPNSDVPEAQRIELDTVTNGVIANRTDVDYFAFAGKKGQRVVAHCAASAIDSRLTVHLQLYTSSGRELGSNRFYRDRDALLDCTLPEDGDYHLRVCDFAYQGGGSEYGYRLTVSTKPWIDAAFPPAVPAGKASQVTLYGRNLPNGQPVPGMPGREQLTVTVNAPAEPAPFPGRLLPRVGAMDGFAYRLPGSNPVFLAFADGPVVSDNGKNDGADAAQAIAVPCDVCGRFEKRGDRDYYAFEAKKGDELVIEGFADRLRARTDLYFVLHRAKDGQMLGEFDTHPDVPERAERFFTYTDDPLARFKAPEDGTYHLVVRSRNVVTGKEPRDLYRISIRRDRPDYRLMLVGNHDNGAGFTLHRGGAQSVQVVCLRQDGFDGEITLAAEGLPAGVACAPQMVGPKVQEATLVFTAAADAKDWAGEFRVTGTATINGQKVTRAARAGTLVFPTNNPNTLAVSRLSRSLCLAVRDAGPFRVSAVEKELAVPVGGAAMVKVKVDAQRPDMKDAVNVALEAGPVQSNGRRINVGAINVAPSKEGQVRVPIPSNAPPGRYNLVFRGSGRYALDDPQTKKKRNTQFAAVSTPVVLTVYSSACELTLPESVVVKPGAETVVTVNVKRLHKYNGPITLEVNAPSGGTGLSAANVTVPEGANQGKLILKAAPNAKPARELAFTIRATARIDNATLREETKFAVTVGDAAPKGNAKIEALLAAGAGGWRYMATVKGDDWLKPDFDDKAWKEMKAPIGYGEGEIGTRKGTEVGDKGQPVYVRRAFEVPAETLKQKGTTFRLKVASDNSAAVYLNGKAIDEDSADHEFSYWNRDVVIPTDRLKPGRNVLAVRVANTSGSSDLYFDLTVTADVPTEAKK